MKSQLLTILVLAAAAMQVACSDDPKMLTQAQRCAQDPICVQKATSAANLAKLTGPAAAAGVPQVAPTGTTPVAGDARVPSLATQPASISNADLQKHAAQINATMAAMSVDPDYATTNGVHTLMPASSAPSSSSAASAEITVARLPEARLEPVQQRQPAAAHAPDLNSIATQPEATGASAAH